jgi:uncharacterized protein involved in exopolysaccharide biosynthesis
MIATSVRDASDDSEEAEISFWAMLLPLAEHWRLLAIAPLLAGLMGYGVAVLVPPTFTARTSLLVPQPSQSVASSALASLGSLSGIAGAATRTPGDQYVALMRSTTLSDRLIDRFGLINAYESKFRSDARKELSENVRIELGKKDGLIVVEVDDRDAKRASDIANRYIDELRQLTAVLALTEAQQRRAFFENHLRQSRANLADAQQALEGSGFSAGALRAEPKAAAEAYARLKAEVASTEVRLQAARQYLADGAPEVQQLLSTLALLRSRLVASEASNAPNSSSGYLTRYREFKYQESLLELFSRQYEMARVDESREGTLIQVVDMAQPPERRSKPRRAIWAVYGAAGALFCLLVFIFTKRAWSTASGNPQTSDDIERLRQSLSSRSSSASRG